MTKTPVVFKDESGGSHDVSSALESGKPVTLVFWQTWCANCREEGPDLAQAAKTWSGKIDYFGIVSGPDSVVDGTELDRLVNAFELPYPQIRDRDGSIAERFHVQSTPTILVLGKGGKELYRGNRLPGDWAAFAAR